MAAGDRSRGDPLIWYLKSFPRPVTRCGESASEKDRSRLSSQILLGYPSAVFNGRPAVIGPC